MTTTPPLRDPKTGKLTDYGRSVSATPVAAAPASKPVAHVNPHPEWDPLKAWVRDEIQMAATGNDMEDRKKKNP